MLTREDKAKRIGKITSSVAAACLGLDEHMTQVDAWMAIRGEAPDLADDPRMRKAIERGNRLEDSILDYPADMLDLYRTKAPFRSIAPWAGDSCDALYFLTPDKVSSDDPWRDLDSIGEGKSAAMGVGGTYGEEGTDDVPNHTLIQSHWHLIHWPEVNTCHVPVLVGGYKFDFRLYHVRRNAEFEGILCQDLERWHRDYIIGNKVPPVSAGDGEWLKNIYPRSKPPGSVMADTPELREIAKRKVIASRDKADAEAREELAKNQIRAILGDFEEVRGDWGSITWRNNAPSFKTDWQKVANAIADLAKISDETRTKIIADMTAEVPGPRVLRVTPNKQTKKELGI